jgi:hypothetical protein
VRGLVGGRWRKKAGGGRQVEGLVRRERLPRLTRARHHRGVGAVTPRARSATQRGSVLLLLLLLRRLLLRHRERVVARVRHHPAERREAVAAVRRGLQAVQVPHLPAQPAVRLEFETIRNNSKQFETIRNTPTARPAARPAAARRLPRRTWPAAAATPTSVILQVSKWSSLWWYPTAGGTRLGLWCKWSCLSTAGGAPLLEVPGWACGVSGAASRQLVVPHRWRYPAGRVV